MFIVFDKAFGTFLDEDDVIFDKADKGDSDNNATTTREIELFGILKPERSWSEPASQLQGFTAIVTKWWQGTSATTVLQGPGYRTATRPRLLKYPASFHFRLTSQLTRLGTAYLVLHFLLVLNVGILLLLLPLPLPELMGLATWVVCTLYLHGLVWDGRCKAASLEAVRCSLSLATLLLFGEQLQLARALGSHWPLIKGYATLVCTSGVVVASLAPAALLGRATGVGKAT
jgi:hypothetical protein